MFFFGNEKCTITFEVSSDRIDHFDLALEKLKITKEEAFDAFLTLLIGEALKPRGSHSAFAPSEPTPLKRLSPEQIRSRIRRWAGNPTSGPHRMIAAYLTCRANLGDHDEVPFPKMCAIYNDLEGIKDTFDAKKFTSLLRQMCSSSGRAYGKVFDFDRRDRNITLNPEFRQDILDLYDSFMKVRFGLFHD